MSDLNCAQFLASLFFRANTSETYSGGAHVSFYYLSIFCKVATHVLLQLLQMHTELVETLTWMPSLYFENSSKLIHLNPLHCLWFDSLPHPYIFILILGLHYWL